MKVRVRARLTANAAAGATRITLRKGARFSERQVRALAHHEGLWHVLTSLNGYRQPVLTVLGVGLPRHTESQEGGGIVAEYLTGNITDERYIELGERTIAIDMAARGADFLEVYRYLLARFPPQKAALMSERVFRGGVVEGGAPFTKDAAYQRGYCRTFNFLRAALEQRDLDLVRAFLAGKMSVDDAELVRDLIEEGLCVGPVYLPEWFIDIDRLNAIATHCVTMNRFSLPSVTRYYAARRKAGAPAESWSGDAVPSDSEERPTESPAPTRAISASSRGPAFTAPPLSGPSRRARRRRSAPRRPECTDDAPPVGLEEHVGAGARRIEAELAERAGPETAVGDAARQRGPGDPPELAGVLRREPLDRVHLRERDDERRGQLALDADPPASTVIARGDHAWTARSVPPMATGTSAIPAASPAHHRRPSGRGADGRVGRGPRRRGGAGEELLQESVAGLGRQHEPLPGGVDPDEVAPPRRVEAEGAEAPVPVSTVVAEEPTRARDPHASSEVPVDEPGGADRRERDLHCPQRPLDPKVPALDRERPRREPPGEGKGRADRRDEEGPERARAHAGQEDHRQDGGGGEHHDGGARQDPERPVPG